MFDADHAGSDAEPSREGDTRDRCSQSERLADSGTVDGHRRHTEAEL